MWEKRILQTKYNQPFIQSEIDYFAKAQKNTQFKIIFLYGDAGTFKSTIQNIYMGQNILEAGRAKRGVTQGVIFCIQNNVILVDTEGLGTDNSSSNRADIVSLLCFASAMIVTETIITRFRGKNIIDSIKAICQTYDIIKGRDCQNLVKPKLEIIVTLVKLDSEELKECEERAQEMLRNSELRDINKYFSSIRCTLIDSLGDDLLNIIKKEKKELTQNQWPFEIRNKINSVFQSALQSPIRKSGSDFEQLPMIYQLASGEIDAGSYSYESILKINTESKQYYYNSATIVPVTPDNFDNYNSNLNSIALKSRTLIENKFSAQPVLKNRIIENLNISIGEINNALYSSFNDQVFSNYQTLLNNYKNQIISQYKPQNEIDDKKIISEMNEIRQKLNSLQSEINNLKYPPLHKTSESTKKKLLNLADSEITGIKSRFVENYIASSIENNIKTDFMIKMFSLGTEESLNEEIRIRLLNFSKHFDELVNNFLPKKNIDLILKKSEIAIEEFMKKKYRDEVFPIYQKFEQNFNRESIKLRDDVNEIINMVQFHADRSTEEKKKLYLVLYDPIKEFGDLAVRLHQRLYDEFSKIYEYKWDEITNLTYLESDFVSILSSQKAFYSVSYILCPHCNTPWELETNRSLGWHGCGNFTCNGKFLCQKQFRIFNDKGNSNNPLARHLTKDEFLTMYEAYIEEMAGLMKTSFRAILPKRISKK